MQHQENRVQELVWKVEDLSKDKDTVPHPEKRRTKNHIREMGKHLILIHAWIRLRNYSKICLCLIIISLTTRDSLSVVPSS